MGHILGESREGGCIGRLGQHQVGVAVGGGRNRGGILHTHQIVGRCKGSAAAKVQLIALAWSSLYQKARTGRNVGGLHQVDRAVQVARNRIGRHTFRLTEVKGIRAAERIVGCLGLIHQMERCHHSRNESRGQDSGYCHFYKIPA